MNVLAKLMRTFIRQVGQIQ